MNPAYKGICVISTLLEMIEILRRRQVMMLKIGVLSRMQKIYRFLICGVKIGSSLGNFADLWTRIRTSWVK